MSIKDLFDPKCRAHFIQLWSNQLALLFGAIMAFLVEQPTVALSFVTNVPQPYRSLIVFFVTAVVPIVVRMLNQPKVAAQIAAEGER